MHTLKVQFGNAKVEGTNRPGINQCVRSFGNTTQLTVGIVGMLFCCDGETIGRRGNKMFESIPSAASSCLFVFARIFVHNPTHISTRVKADSAPAQLSAKKRFKKISGKTDGPLLLNTRPKIRRCETKESLPSQHNTAIQTTRQHHHHVVIHYYSYKYSN
jgi:hypothetical protein